MNWDLLRRELIFRVSSDVDLDVCCNSLLVTKPVRNLTDVLPWRIISLKLSYLKGIPVEDISLSPKGVI